MSTAGLYTVGILNLKTSRRDKIIIIESDKKVTGASEELKN